MSDNGASSDDDAKTERYRDPSPPGDDFVPRGEEYMPIAAATGLLLPVVTREQARDAQQADDDNEPDRYDKDDAAAAKEPKPKKTAQEPKKQQLRRWAFRYCSSNMKTEAIELKKLMHTAKTKLNADITRFRQITAPKDNTHMCVEFHTSRRILRPKMMAFLANTFGIEEKEELFKSEEKLLAKEIHAPSAKEEKDEQDVEDNTNNDIVTAFTKRLVDMEKTVADLRKLPDRMDAMRAKMRTMKERIVELEKSNGVVSD